LVVAPALFDGGDFDLNLDRSEALGHMLGSVTPSDLLADIPGAVLEGPVPESSPEVRPPPLPPGESEGQDKDAPVAPEFEESTRMVSADDQLRLAREAEETSKAQAISEFDESTRLVSAQDQVLLLTKALEEVAKPKEVGEVAPDESLTLDSEFYETIDIAGEGAPGKPSEQPSAEDEVSSVPDQKADGAPLAVVEAGSSSEKQTPAPVPHELSGRPLVAELDEYDEDSGLGSLDLLLGLSSPSAPPPAPSDRALPPDLPRDTSETEASSHDASGTGGAPADSVESVILPAPEPLIGVQRDDLAAAAPAQESSPVSQAVQAERVALPPVEAPSAALDSILGSAAGSPSAAVTPEPDLSSLDELLGLAGSTGAAMPASSIEAPILAGAPATRVGWDLPDPPASRQLGSLAASLKREVLPDRLPDLELPQSAEESLRVDALPEMLPFAQPDRASLEEGVQWLESEARNAQDAPLAASLEASAATFLEVLLEDWESAQPHYLEAVSLDGASLTARRGQLRCALRGEDWGTALEALSALTEVCSGAEHAAYQVFAADLALSTMGDADRAQAAYQSLAEAPETSMIGLLGMCDLGVFQAETSLLATGMRKLAESLRSSELAAPLALEAARRLEILEEDEQADLCYARAAEAPGDVGLAGREGRARIALRREDWHAAAERLRSVMSGNSPGLARARAAARLLRVLDAHLDQKQEAFETAETLLKDAPEDLAAALRLASMAEAQGRHAEAASAYEQAARVVRSPDLGGVYLSFAGELRERFLGEPEAAAACYRTALERSPALALPAMLDAEQRVRSSTSESRVRSWMDRAKGSTDERDRDAAWAMTGRELLLQGRKDESIAALREAAQSGAPGRAVLRELAVALEGSGDLAAAAQSLKSLARQVEPALAAALRHRAVILEARLGPEQRRAAYALGLEDDESLHGLRWALERAHRWAGDAEAWESALGSEAELLEDHGRAARLLRLVGWNRLWRGEPEKATEPLERALGLEPSDPHLNTALMRIAAARGDYEGVERREAELAVHACGPGARSLWEIRRAVCLENRLHRDQDAAEIYRALAARHAGWEVPSEALLRLRRWGGDRHQVAAALKSQAESSSTPALKVARLLLAATELDLAGEPDSASPVLSVAASLAPGDPLVRSLQEAVEIELGNWAVLAEHALAALEKAEDDASRVAAYAALASVDRDGRDDLQSAVFSYESILRLDPTSTFVLRELELHYPLERKLDEMAEVARRLADACTGQDRVAHAFEWARLRGDARDLDGLVAGLRLALAAGPEDLPTLTRLETHSRREARHEELGQIYEAVSRLFESDSRAKAVFLMRAAEATLAEGAGPRSRQMLAQACLAEPRYLPALEERLRQALLYEDWPEAVSAAEGLAEASALREVQVGRRFLAGVLAEDRLADPGRAIENFQAVLALAPGHGGAFDRLCALLRTREDWPGLARLLSSRIDDLGVSRRAADLLWELAQVERGPLGDPNAAKITLRRLISLDDQHLEAVRAATSLYQADDQYVEMADMLIRQARLEQEPAELIRVFYRLGELYDERIPDPKRAIASFTKVLQMDQRNIPALERLSGIQLRQEDWKSALAINGRLLELETSPERRIARLLTLAQILERGYRDPRRAREALIKALEIDPLDLRAVGELSEFYQRQNDRRSLMVHLDRTITVVRGKLMEDAFDPEQYRTLMRLFEWRKSPDQQLCAASALVALGHGTSKETEFIANAGRLAPRLESFAEPELDEIIFPSAVISGFRQAFKLMGPLLGRPFRSDLQEYGASRTTKVTKSGDPLRDQAAQMALRMGVPAFDLHVVSARPNVIAVEPYDPPVLILGSAVVEGASEAERAFVLGRCLKIVQSQMILPIKLDPARLRGLVAGIVKQHVEDFEPREVPPVELLEQTRTVAKQLSRKLKGELMPFSFECAGISDFAGLCADLAKMANRAGLLAAGDLGAAVRVLLREAGRPLGSGWSDSPLASTARGVESVEQMLRYAVSEEYFELRGRMGLA
jgi:tetratricopeptide (TPR) repeat protein